MSRTFALGLATMVAIGASRTPAPSVKAFHGGSHGSHGGFFGGSRGSHGGSFGGLFHRNNGSSGGYGSHGGNGNSCACDCNGSDEAVEGDHEDNDNHADRGDRVMDSPSREAYRDDRRGSREVRVYERDRNGRRVESRVTQESNKDDRDHKDADHKQNGDQKKDKEVKQNDNKDKDAKKDENKAKDKETDSDKEKKNNEK